MIDALFFDFDGTLVDSVEVKTSAFAHMFSEFGETVVNKVIGHHRKNGGMSRYDKFRFYYRNYLDMPLDDQLMEKLCQRFADLVEDEVVAAEEIPGAMNFLDSHYQNTPCVVISAAPEQELTRIIQRKEWFHYFKYVLGAPVDKEENLKHALHLLKVDPSRCIFFGDGLGDHHAARSLVVPFWGIVNGRENPLLSIVPEIKWSFDFNGVDLKKAFS